MEREAFVPANEGPSGHREAAAALRTVGALRRARRERAAGLIAKLSDSALGFAAQDPAYPVEIQELARLQLSARIGAAPAGRLISAFPRLLAPPPAARPRVLVLGTVDRRFLRPFRILRNHEGGAVRNAAALARVARALDAGGPLAGPVRATFDPRLAAFGFRMLAHAANAIVADSEAEAHFETLAREGLAERLLVLTPEGALARVQDGLPPGAKTFPTDRIDRETRRALHAAIRDIAARGRG